MKDPQPTMHPIWRLVHSGGGGAFFLALWLVACDAFQDPSGPSLTIYTSQDQVYAEPIFKAFEETSGIRVKALYDHESVKSMGLAKRLVAEKGHPICDLFWSNESLTMRQLLEKGVIHSLESFGYRSRVMIINTRAMTPDKAPATLLEWAEPQWRNRCVMAYPLFGTTATHMLALRQKWGDEAWSHWCQKLADNGLRTVDGNSAVVQMVGRGDAWIGLTDSDDLAVGLRQGLPLVSIPLNQELCPIVNSVGWVRTRSWSTCRLLCVFPQSTYNPASHGRTISPGQPGSSSGRCPLAQADLGAATQRRQHRVGSNEAFFHAMTC